MSSRFRTSSLVATCGLAGTVNAQPYEVTISGATLLENFLNSSAATNDFIDLDGDTVAGSVNFNNEQLANTGTTIVAAQASDFTEATALGMDVRVELDRPRTRGKYGRLLAYVYLPDGAMLNSVLVAGGYAYADPRYRHRCDSEFRRLQRQARASRAGLWGGVRADELPYYCRGVLPPTE